MVIMLLSLCLQEMSVRVMSMNAALLANVKGGKIA